MQLQNYGLHTCNGNMQWLSTYNWCLVFLTWLQHHWSCWTPPKSLGLSFCWGYCRRDLQQLSGSLGSLHMVVVQLDHQPWLAAAFHLCKRPCTCTKISPWSRDRETLSSDTYVLVSTLGLSCPCSDGDMGHMANASKSLENSRIFSIKNQVEQGLKK